MASQHAGQPGAHDRVIIYDQDANRITLLNAHESASPTGDIVSNAGIWLDGTPTDLEQPQRFLFRFPVCWQPPTSPKLLRLFSSCLAAQTQADLRSPRNP